MNDFWLGICIAFCWNQMCQAWIGKEQFLKAADVLWMNDPWWFWAAAMAVCLLLNQLQKRFR